MTSDGRSKNSYKNLILWIPILALFYYIALSVLLTIFPDLNPQPYRGSAFFPVMMFLSLCLTGATLGTWYSLKELRSINGGRMFTNSRVSHIIFLVLYSIVGFLIIDFILLIMSYFYSPFLQLTHYYTANLPQCIILLFSLVLGVVIEIRSDTYRRLECGEYLDPEVEKLAAIQQAMEQQAQNAGQPKVVERVVIREVVKVRCQYCGTLVDITEMRCPSCGAPFGR